MELLTRQRFHDDVFQRDGGRCVVCGAPAVDAHHIVGRAQFADGGYYLDNGVAVCATCHVIVERPGFPHDALRALIGLREVSAMFRHGVDTPARHPRTLHLPWSQTVGKDDRVISTLEHLRDREVVVTAKLDGECTTMYHDRLHARSPTSGRHPSRSRVTALWGRISHVLDANWRVCGENMQARHAIGYRNLPSVFFVHSLWFRDTVMSWDFTQNWCRHAIGVPTVPVVWRGPYSRVPWLDLGKCEFTGWCDHDEGYVVRDAADFECGAWDTRVAKFVRGGFQPGADHWMHAPMVENGFHEDARIA